MNTAGENQVERRITFRLYESWEKIAGESGLPALKDLHRNDIEPFRRNLVLIDLRNGQENASFQVLGNDLVLDQDENLIGKNISLVPRKTMLSRVTDHYLEVIANRVPIAFEAEFINRDDEKALYRGILLPFSDDGQNINFIMGGVRWILAKDVKLDEDKPTIEELMQSIAAGREDEKEKQEPSEVVSDNDNEDPDETEITESNPEEMFFEIEPEEDPEEEYIEIDETTSFEDEVINEITADLSITEYEELVEEEPVVEEPVTTEVDETELESEAVSQSDSYYKRPEYSDIKAALTATKKYINKQDTSHSRSRDALYNILTAIYKFHDIASDNHTAYEQLISENKLKIQARAPFTPALKMCLGKDYDKTRLTEYAAALGIAQHLGVSVDDFHDFIKNFPGGIKGCVQEMRALRKGMQTGNAVRKQNSLNEARAILKDIHALDTLDDNGQYNLTDDYCLLLARRDGEKLEIIKKLDESHAKIDPILKRAAFIKGNLKKNN
ncbi:hypothetical protein [Pseudemcibacter aquimaris]|uniref:hypothetical protein n=1 Tax=Pseudemcibacter aquimaris TaxID=2857064 RepID=UPI002012D933|nr:hypothetical protein [Pseudemcibacter aquimaris]MCC3861855.1 hypothetical protein [Pseudemcibacter aquimaris]WDU58608.1 hypothetical protein KW060_15610 [Pseudemcibacter aquimaris]